MPENIIRRTIGGMLIPLIQLYALYVIAHGEGGPGGGFQGGVILGSSVILYALIYGVEATRKRIKQKFTDLLCSTGVFVYGGIGVLCLLAGGNYLEYDMLPLGTPEHSSHLGILGIEIGVAITVASVMITLFLETARRDEK